MIKIQRLSPVTKRGILSFLACLSVFQGMGGLMGWITVQGVDGWYQSLRRSPLNPPDHVFGIVWSLLYALLATSFWLVLKSPAGKTRFYLLALFVSHMILNWLWSPLFFSLHVVGASLFVIFTMIFTAAMLAWLIWPVDRRASLIFIPYIAWLFFAGHLCHYILQSN